MFDHKYGVSQRREARKFKIEAPYVNKILRNKSSIKFYKKQNIPKRDEEMRKNGKNNSNMLQSTLQKLPRV